MAFTQTAQTGVKLFSLGNVLLTLFVVWIILQALFMGFKTGDWAETGKTIGKQLYSPLESAQNYAKSINTENIFLSLWSWYGLYSNIFEIFFWIWAIAWLLRWIFGFMAVSNFVRFLQELMIWGSAIIIFLTIQCLYSVYVLNDSMFMPIYAFKDLFDSVIYLITNTKFTFNFNLNPSSFRIENTCNTSVCTI